MSMTAPRPDVPSFMVRRLRTADLAQVDDLCRRQPPDVLRLRFFTTAPHLTGATLAELTDQRNGDRVALVAVEGDRVTGLARYDRVPGTDRADAWLIVDSCAPTPDLDLRLLSDLLAEARNAGIGRLALEVHPLNRDLLAALDECALRTTSHLHSGLVTVTIEVEPCAPPA